MTVTLALDVESTGFLVDGMPPEHPHQPRLVELGLILAVDRSIKSIASLIVRPDDYVIPPSATAVHRIDTELAQVVGVSAATALALFQRFLALADEFVGHNLHYDLTVLETEWYRLRLQNPDGWPSFLAVMSDRVKRDTLHLSSPIVKIPPTDKMRAKGMHHLFKAPSLEEAAAHFFGPPPEDEPSGAHGAFADAQLCLELYWAIQDHYNGRLPP